jgi:hypothetical protein
MAQNHYLSLQGYTHTKPTGRSGRAAHALSFRWMAGTLLSEVSRVWDRQGDWGGHPEGQTFSQLHKNTPQMTQNWAEPQPP